MVLLVLFFWILAMYWALHAKNFSETTPEIACVQDSDCLCRTFSDGKILPGQGFSPGCDFQINRCFPCEYY
ncbi:MAG: hypothetical protein A2828_04010 [Candidatus Terrybacteria bacterium RIFCSPHIGHO2_01_FULL_43_35]|uniref:Uncharacterized protein n=1 Tax=Candidatus Terrybacteria bacterium RIFCSPHIGHO2_01_FULL_43_35 TaxID=1802361 RepID=A0A1G2PHP4_9BACT|nr:MAG: hypothetical protein A2828_04010 [Candidatus Terrybacteria bacterium RIFCSPHIGHO2_01_FULL_43_35]